MARSRYADFNRADFHVTNNQVYDVLGLIFSVTYNNPFRTNFKQLLLILIYPRLISFESDRASGSARHGWRKERCQPWMAVCAARLHDYSQNSEGTLGLISRKEAFAYFSPFEK